MDTGSSSTDQPAAAKPFRRRYQYSLRTLLVFVTLCAVACSWFAVKMQRARRQREAAKAIMKLGGFVGYDYEPTPSGIRLQGVPPGLDWLQEILGNDFFSAIVYVNLSNKNIDTDGGRRFAVLDNTPSLEANTVDPKTGKPHRLLEAKSIADTELECLKDLEGLQYLDLSGTGITDDGMKNLAGLRRIEYLGLDGTQITDAGLLITKRMTKLKNLTLKNTKVTDAGVEGLQKAMPNLKIER